MNLRSSQEAIADFFFKRIAQRVDELLKRHLVPVYVRKVSRYGNSQAPKLTQVGTAFRVQWQGHPFLISAAHVFYGHGFDEDPLDKEVYDGTIVKPLRNCGQCRITPVSMNPDLAIIATPGVPAEICLAPTALAELEADPKLISIVGFLARDFERKRGVGPMAAPRMYTNRTKATQRNHVGLAYPTGRNRNSKTREIVRNPIPAGLSGGPMLDSEQLFNGKICVLGVFTDYVKHKGLAYGERLSASDSKPHQLELP